MIVTGVTGAACALPSSAPNVKKGGGQQRAGQNPHGLGPQWCVAAISASMMPPMPDRPDRASASSLPRERRDGPEGDRHLQRGDGKGVAVVLTQEQVGLGRFLVALGLELLGLNLNLRLLLA